MTINNTRHFLCLLKIGDFLLWPHFSNFGFKVRVNIFGDRNFVENSWFLVHPLSRNDFSKPCYFNEIHGIRLLLCGALSSGLRHFAPFGTHFIQCSSSIANTSRVINITMFFFTINSNITCKEQSTCITLSITIRCVLIRSNTKLN